MGRVLRIGAGLMGVLLVVMTAGLYFVRTEPSTLQVVLANGCIGDQCRVYIAAPQVGWKRPITSTLYGIRGGVWSPNEEWFYWVNSRDFDDYETAGKGEVWRIRADGSGLERLPGDYFSPTPVWTKDGQSYLYVREGEIFQTSLDGKYTQNLTQDFELSLPNNQLLYAPNGESVIFRATRTEPNGMYYYEAHLLRLSERFISPLPMVEIYADNLPLMWVDEGNWLIGNTKNTVYKMRPDGTDYETLFTYGEPPASYHSSTLYVRTWLPSNNVLVVSLYENDLSKESTIGLRLDDGMVLWQLSGLRFQEKTLDGGKLIFSSQDGSLYQMNTTEQLLQMIGMYDGALPYRPSPDGQWAAYNLLDSKNQYNLYLIHLNDGESEFLASNLSVAAWSQDSEWVVLIDYSFVTPPKLLNINTREIIPLRSGTFSLGILTWLHPPAAEWQPSMLLIIGIGLIGISIFGKRPNHLIRQHRRPAA